MTNLCKEAALGPIRSLEGISDIFDIKADQVTIFKVFQL